MIFYSQFPTKGIEINKFGNRGNVRPDPSRKIIACLGCSHTYGLVEEEHTWPCQLESMLGEKYQSLNMGRINYGLKLNLMWYDVFMGKSPSVCVLQVPQFFRQPFPGLQSNHPIHFTYNNGARLCMQEVGRKKFEKQSEEMMKRELKRFDVFHSKLKQDNVRLIVLMYEATSYALLLKLNCEYLKRLQSKCDSLGISHLSGKEFTLDNFLERDYLHDLSHPNMEGNKFIAQRIHDIIDPWSNRRIEKEVPNWRPTKSPPNPSVQKYYPCY